VPATDTRLATAGLDLSSCLAWHLRTPLGVSVWLWCISHTVSHPTDPCQAKATLNREFLVARCRMVARELDAAELGMTHVIVARPRASSLSNVQVI
jgi:hypothetical protein